MTGTLLLGLSYYISKKPISSVEDKNLRIGFVIRDSGKAEIVRNGFTVRKKIESRSLTLNQLDSVETADVGSAIVSLESADKIKILDNSFVTFERVEDAQDFHIDVIIKRGDIRVLNFGRDGELFIAKNGERLSANEYNNSSLSKTVATSPPTTEAVLS